MMVSTDAAYDASDLSFVAIFATSYVMIRIIANPATESVNVDALTQSARKNVSSR